jgi:hypothetical protein
MALVLKDRVKETATANTTVSFTLGGAIAGFQSFSVVGNTNTTYYAATDTNGNWEAGLGTYSTTGPTLTRTTILSSSNSGSAVTFSGTVSVFLTYPSSRSIYLDGTSAGINVSQAAFTSNGIPYASSTTALATGSALTFDGTNFATTGTATAKSFTPTSSTAPTYGIYRPTSETIGIYVGSAAPVKAGTYGLASGSVTTPAARMHIDSVGNLNGYSPTTTNAFGFYNAGGAFVNPDLYAVTQINVNSLKISSLQIDDGTDPDTIQLATTLYIEGSPTAASITTITSSYALYIASGASYFGGAVTTTGTGTFSNTTGNKLVVSGNISQAAWTTTGPAISVATGTYTSSAGLTGTVAANSLGTPTFAATTASQTVTNAATLYISAAPANGTNVTITNAYSLYIAAGTAYFGGAVTLNSGGALSGTFTGAHTYSGAVTLSGGGSLSGTFTGTPTFSGAITLSGTPSISTGASLAGTFTGTPTFSGAIVLSGTPSISNGAALTGTFSGNPAFSGNSRFGGTSAATVAVDVTGAVLATGNVTGGYNNPAAGTTAMAFGSYNVVKVTPNATASYTTTVPAAGTRLTLIVLTSGTSSYVITFSTGFKTTGTLTTGTTSARYFMISFVSDGTNVLETSRTVAIA